MLARDIGVHRQSINRILQGEGDATVSMLESMVDVYHANPGYLLSGEGEMFIKETLGISPTIAYVPFKAFAGYSNQFQDVAFLEDFQYFSLPDVKFKEGTYRCFDIQGDSMIPSFMSGDKVVCSLVYNVYYEQLLKNNAHYVVVTKEDVLLKKVINDIKQNKSVTLLSENSLYPPITFPIQEVKEMWKVEMRLTEDFKRNK